MINSVDAVTISSSHATTSQQRETSGVWGGRIALAMITLLSLFMDFFRLGENGYGNLYYAASVRSMTDSWHNFFFASFDPGGFISIDKPPLGFWLQVVSAHIFGFTAFSIFLPQALCGVLTVLLLYVLVRRHFGVVAGLISALALAITPISVVTDRNNTIDGTLALILLLAAWAVIHAAETGKLRWLLLSAVFVGLGFNVKMAEAYLVVPALGLTYFLCAPRKLWTRLWQLSLALMVMLLLSLSWAAIVDLVPAAQRPYVGSTQDNSALNLAFGYNGLSRIHIGALGTSSTVNHKPAQKIRKNGSGIISRHLNNTDGKWNAGFKRFFQTNAIGPFHLLSSALGGQIAWLLPLALLALVALAWQKRFDFRRDRQQLGLVLWGTWLLTMACFFSVSTSFHVYYMTEMAPGLSALVGIGLVVMWHDYRGTGWRGWLLPIALATTAAVQIHLLAFYPSYAHRISAFICIVTIVTVMILLLMRIRQIPKIHKFLFSLGSVIVSLELMALFIAPALWSGYSVMHNLEAAFPVAGPNSTQANTLTFTSLTKTLSASKEHSSITAKSEFTMLISYLQVHRGKTKFLVATQGAGVSEDIILAINKPAMALGGFSGKDPVVSIAKAETLIKENTIRFFMVTHGQPTTLSNWVSTHCTVVPTLQWSNTKISRLSLFDCAHQHAYKPVPHRKAKSHPVPHRKAKSHRSKTI
jgi:4-amino-4-deoxy-L-arabinose transferase-like glycosyltransferase